MTNATIHRLRIPVCGNLTAQLTAQSSVRDQSEKVALELAVASDELSLRMLNLNSKSVTALQIKKFNYNVARVRTLLAQLETSIGQLRPDET